METCPSISGILRRLTSFCLIGAAVLLFMGPILTLLVMIAVCAAVGFLVWLPLHSALLGRHCVWQAVAQHQSRCRKWVEDYVRDLRRRRLAIAARYEEVTWRWIVKAREVAVEIACGALAAMIVAIAAGFRDQAVGMAVLLGAIAGGAVALGRHANSRTSP